jgi:hypothetical protein
MLAAVMLTGPLAGPAGAAPYCASPAEMKLLKAAVLEQALTAAAQSCHLNAEFSRFVATYKEGMVASDQALKVFFSSHKTSEGYEGYKARIAGQVSLKSLHDASFCADASRVFAIALKQEKAPPPSLIPTGYENCARPAPLLSAAMVEHKSPEAATTAALSLRKPVETAKPVLRPAIAERLPGVFGKTAAAKTSAKSPLAEIPPAKTAAVTPSAVKANPAKSSQTKPSLAKPSAIKPAPVKAAVKETKPVFKVTVALHAVPEPSAKPASGPSAETPRLSAMAHAIVPAVATVREPQAPYGDHDPVPNAYKPGAQWVHQTEYAVPPAEYQPRPPGPNLYLGVDNRWHLIPHSASHWGE